MNWLVVRVGEAFQERVTFGLCLEGRGKLSLQEDKRKAYLPSKAQKDVDVGENKVFGSLHSQINNFMSSKNRGGSI